MIGLTITQLEINMKLTIELDGVYRNYEVDEDNIYNNDWNKIIQDIYETTTK